MLFVFLVLLFFVVLRIKNLDLVAKEYNDYKKFADIANSIIIHK